MGLRTPITSSSYLYCRRLTNTYNKIRALFKRLRRRTKWNHSTINSCLHKDSVKAVPRPICTLAICCSKMIKLQRESRRYHRRLRLAASLKSKSLTIRNFLCTLVTHRLATQGELTAVLIRLQGSSSRTLISFRSKFLHLLSKRANMHTKAYLLLTFLFR